MIFGGFWGVEKSAFFGPFLAIFPLEKWPDFWGAAWPPRPGLSLQKPHFFDFFWLFWWCMKTSAFMCSWKVMLLCVNDDVDDDKSWKKVLKSSKGALRARVVLAKVLLSRRPKIRFVDHSNFRGRALSIVWFRDIVCVLYMGAIKNLHHLCTEGGPEGVRPNNYQ